MKRIITITGAVMILAVVLTFCTKDDTADPDQVNYIQVSEKVSENSLFSLEMCTCEDALYVGYNRVYFKLKNKSSGEIIKNATLNLRPEMDMGTFKHACPLENPGENANSRGYFEGAILFSMPGTDSWSVDVDISAAGITDSVHFALHEVIATVPGRKIVVIDSLEITPGVWKITKYPISLVLPKEWKVGLNTFEFTIHKMEGYYSFPAVSDMVVEIEPEMPSMGHGSPNNINPVHAGNGHYKGTVNFTMTGDWRIHLKLTRDNRVITENAYFDILF